MIMTIAVMTALSSRLRVCVTDLFGTAGIPNRLLLSSLRTACAHCMPSHPSVLGNEEADQIH
jgi:hypothetical protein